MPLSERDKDTPLLIYDGDCTFCRFWVERWKERTGEALLYAPYQDVAELFPEIPLSQFRAAAQFRDGNGRFSSGAEAVFRTLACAPGKSRRWPLWAHERVPLFGLISEAVYRWVARHREGLYRLMRWVGA
jgi:predicted DCC family thiol-disulfide oxidoreductase YuxK